MCVYSEVVAYMNILICRESLKAEILRLCAAGALWLWRYMCIVIERCGRAGICGPSRGDSGDCLNSFCGDEKHHTYKFSNCAAKSFNCEF